MSMTYKQRDDFDKALKKILSMTVDEFQNQLEKHKIDYWKIDSYVFDLAKVLIGMESSNE